LVTQLTGASRLAGQSLIRDLLGTIADDKLTTAILDDGSDLGG
jgi:hypothetical protein